MRFMREIVNTVKPIIEDKVNKCSYVTKNVL